MTDSAMRDLPRIQQQVLSCISEDWKTEREIAYDFRNKYPPDLETFRKWAKKVRQKAFNEKDEAEIIPNVQWQLNRLLKLGYVEPDQKEFHKGEVLAQKTWFYCLSSFGRSALLAARQSKNSL